MQHGGGWSADGITLPGTIIFLGQTSHGVYIRVPGTSTNIPRHARPRSLVLRRPHPLANHRLDSVFLRRVPRPDGAVSRAIHESQLVDDVHGEQRCVQRHESVDVGEVGEYAGDDPGGVAVLYVLAV